MENRRPAGVDAPPAPRPASTPREVVTYLKGVRDLVSRANQSRQAWIRQLGHLLRAADDSAAPAEASRIGREQGETFVQMRTELEGLVPPAVCDSCRFSLTSWLDKHVAACEIMVEAGQSGELTRLRSAQGLLAEARVDLQRFNSDCETLIAALRRRAEVAKARRSARSNRQPRWPFGGRPPAGTS